VAEKVLLIKLKTTAEGQPVIAGFGRSLDAVASAENRLQREMHETSAASRMHSNALAGATASLKGWIVAAGGVVAAGALFKQVFTYHQDYEATQNAIAGLLFAQQKYVDGVGRAVDETTAWSAANHEAVGVMTRLQQESLKTSATVPQIADAFALVMGAMGQAGQDTSNFEKVITLTTRLTQAAGAMKVPLEQMRQEINSIMTGQVTQDSTIAHRLGLDNASIKELQRNGSLADEIIKRTAAYALAADAQANTVRGKLVNTVESIVATLSRAFDPIIQRSKGALDGVSEFFAKYGDGIASFVRRAIAAGDELTGRVGAWASEHQAFLKEVGSVALIAGGVVAAYGAIAASIALLTSPITMAIAGVVALAFAWEKTREYSEIQVGGVAIGAWVKATTQVVVSAFTSMVIGVGGLLKALWYAAKTAFGMLGEVILFPLRTVVGQVNALLQAMPSGLAALIPGFEKIKSESAQLQQRIDGMFTPGANADKWADSMRDTWALVAEVNNVGMENATAALEGNKGFQTKPSEIVKGAYELAIEWINSKLPALKAAGKAAMDALAGAHSAGSKGGGPAADPKVLAALEKNKEQYLNFIDQFRSEAEAKGDPLSQALAKIETDREAAIRKLEAQKKDLQGALGIDFEADTAAINQHFDVAMVEASRSSLEKINAQTLRETRALYELTTGIAIDAQQRTTDRRLSLIYDEIEKEKQARLADNDSWLSAQLLEIEQAYTNETLKQTAIETVRAEYRERNVEAETDAQKKIREQNGVTADHYKKLAEALKQQFRSIGQIVIDSILEARVVLANSINGFMDDLLDGQASLIDSLTGLSKGLSKIWTKNLTDILMNGKNVIGQLKDLFKNMHVKNENGSTDWIGTAGQGAGFGGMVGGMFQGPNNQAGAGGAIGGAIGAVVGSIFPVVGTALGAVIGTAIGTLVGSMIVKGKDEIKVAIVNGIARVTEKGISAAARAEVQIQIQRKVNDEMKAWAGIFDRFPEHIKAELERLKLLNPSLNLTGGVETADLTDEGALNSLTDFLGDDLPKAAFGAYQKGITQALSMMGVGKERMVELMAYWGTLQGKELQDAVKAYINTMLDAVEIRDKFKAPFADRFDEAKKRSSMTALGQIDDIDAKLQTAAASMAKLTDIDDLIAAQQEVNRLANQRYEMEIQYLQRIQQISAALSASIANQKEQLELGGMDDQGKVDFFFQKMVDLRGQLAAATDPEEISRLTQEIQRYISQASGIAPDNDEMRRKLLGILDDIDKIAQSRLGQAIKDVETRDKKPADALTTAADLLMKAAKDISDALRPSGRIPGKRTGSKPGDGGGGDGGNDDRDGGGRNKEANSMDRYLPGIAASSTNIADLLRDLRTAPSIDTPPVKAKEIGDAVAAALEGLELSMVTPIQTTNPLGEPEVRYIVSRAVAHIKANPYDVLPRT
jgi:hypothetical protein